MGSDPSRALTSCLLMALIENVTYFGPAHSTRWRSYQAKEKLHGPKSVQFQQQLGWQEIR